MNGRDSLFPLLDDDLVRALSWCRLGGAKFGRPERDESFYEAERLGLLAHDPIWRATPQGEGVLIALGLLDPTWVVDRSQIRVLWAREPRENAPAQFVAAWTSGFAEHYDEGFAEAKRAAEAQWREWPGEGQKWLFFMTSEELGRP